MGELRSSFWVRLTETNIGELVGTPDTDRRVSLMELCGECLGFGDCLIPHHWIITEMATRHRREGSNFNWQNVDVTAPIIADAIADGNLLSDEAPASEQREHMKSEAARFLSILRESREKFKDEFNTDEPLPDLAGVIGILKAAEGVFWMGAAGLYERATDARLNEHEIKSFVAECPSFHAVALVSVLGQYQYGMPKDRTPAKYKAHFFDLLTGCHLPYCDLFVTNEKQQQNALEVIAREVGMSVVCDSWIDFSSRMLCRAEGAKA